MTTTTGAGTDPHPEVTEISDLTEGLLPPDRAVEVREHIARCALCADVLASLEEIRGLLGTLPGPQRIPADIAGRIDAALAAEAHLDTVLPGPRVPRGTSSVTRVPRETSPVVQLGDRDRRRHPWKVGLIAAASVAGAVLIGGVLHAAGSAGGGSAGSDAAASAKKDTGSVSRQDPVADQVRLLLAGAAPSGGATRGADSPMFNAPGKAGGQPPQGSPGVPPCVLGATQRSQPPLASERELFEGTDAYLLVLPHPGDPSTVDAYVVNASCPAGRPGTVLFRSSYSR
ncbi:anti-sigma factor family protein [Streptomyces sp. NBC_01190]|uniref:anti-sigma factor family protein n=1 Tax=Streptomyces sp. NBC_01190 TaxID=2903767 RepID=UPI00386E0B4B|nr:hypothetical protein OG519_16755 [Streptomyces sp. NBC_01190]